jgi:hypothetical protein
MAFLLAEQKLATLVPDRIKPYLYDAIPTVFTTIAVL